jgi:hypothetical protein
MFGQGCPEPLFVDELPDVGVPDAELADVGVPDAELADVELADVELADVDVLAVVFAYELVDGFAAVAPAASMPMPRLSPATPATAAAATTGCLSFITCPFTVFVMGHSAQDDSESPRDKPRRCGPCARPKNSRRRSRRFLPLPQPRRELPRQSRADPAPPPGL